MERRERRRRSTIIGNESSDMISGKFSFRNLEKHDTMFLKTLKKRTIDQKPENESSEKILLMIDEKNSLGLNSWDCCEYFLNKKEDKRESLQ